MSETTTTPKALRRSEPFTAIGNLGGDPETVSFEAKTIEKTIYDATIDGPKDIVIELPERNFLKFSICCGGYDDKPLRWLDCEDEAGLAFRARKGDSVAVTGYFEWRPYTDKKTGERKEWRTLVVQGFEIRRMKTREIE